MVRIARRNLARAEIRNATVMCSDAGEFAAFDPYNVLYMYNPFTEVVMRKLVDHVLLSAARRPRELTLIYKNPICHEVLTEAGFQCIGQVDSPKHPVFIYRLPRKDC